jgi:hypothetical protein
MDTHAGGFRRADVGLDLADRIDDGPGRTSAAAEQIRDTNGLLMQELTDYHGLPSRIPQGTFNHSAECFTER